MRKRSGRYPVLAVDGQGSSVVPNAGAVVLLRTAEAKRLRLRLLSIPARHARTGRRRLLHLAATAPFTALALQALGALDRLTIRPAIPEPG